MTTEDRHEYVRERLSDYLDGSLATDEAERVGAHLDACSDCAALLHDLQRIVAASRALGPMDPPRDLWPGIASAMGSGRGSGGPTSGVDRAVTPLYDRADRSWQDRSSRPWPWSSRTMLAAAAVILVSVSASLAWWGRGVVTSPPDNASAALPPPSAVRSVGLPPGASVPESLATELQELESTVAAARSRLDPGTVEVLERNLLLIERAIEDSYQALALDPENDFVREHLQRTYQRKRDILVEVSRLVELAG